MSAPFLTICVPSRNRQLYFKQTITALLRNRSADIEFVFTDNSDDPTIMNDFMQTWKHDPLIKYLPSGPSVFSMVDNWERSAEASTGQWVCFIGDDDYIDTDIASLIEKIAAIAPAADAISWNRLAYNWPGTRPHDCPVAVPIGDMIVEVPRDLLMRRMFGWERATIVPECLFSIYHACVRRDLLETIKAKYGGRYFQHPTVDFDSSFKILNTAKKFISIERPYSVLGACPQSNSASVGRMEDMKKKHAEFLKDLGRNMDEDPFMKGFPFPSILGVSAAIAAAQHWFKVTYAFDYPNWEINFVKACELSCNTAESPEAFEFYKEGYRKAFAAWNGGIFARHFNPNFKVATQAPIYFVGAKDRLAFVDEHINGVATPADLYDTISAILVLSREMKIAIQYLNPES